MCPTPSLPQVSPTPASRGAWPPPCHLTHSASTMLATAPRSSFPHQPGPGLGGSAPPGAAAQGLKGDTCSPLGTPLSPPASLHTPERSGPKAGARKTDPVSGSCLCPSKGA